MPPPKRSSKKGGSNTKYIAIGIFVVLPVLFAIFLARGNSNGNTERTPHGGGEILQRAIELDKQTKTAEAAQYLLPHVMQNPDWSMGHYNLGIYLRKLGNFSGSAHHNDEALRSNPNFIQAMINGGISYESLGQRPKARELYNRALAIKPDFWEGHNSIAILSHDEGDVETATKHWQHCLRLRPNDAGVKIKLAMMLPPVFESKQKMFELWDGFKRKVDALANDGSLRVQNNAQFDIGMGSFYLGYFGFNAREHMRSLHRLLSRADPNLLFVAPHLRAVGFKPATQTQTTINEGSRIPWEAIPLSAKNRIRVGIISRHLHTHSIGKLTRGLVKYLPRDRIELFVLFPGQTYDAMSEEIASAADHFVRFPATLEAARKRISELKLHFLLFMDIGMESFTYYLSFSRLAPVQAMTHGHPITSGVPTMDLFISFNDYEPQSNQKFYSEELVRIDGHSDRYVQPPMPNPLLQKTDFGFEASDHVYMAPQSLFKFHPDYDGMVLGILRADKRAKIAVIKERHKGWGDIILQRMRRDSGMTPEEESRIVFLPRAPWTTFLNYLHAADVLIDTYPFGGDTSSREALFMSTPVVTLPADQLAGRYTQAFLKTVGADELIATSADDFVQKAVAVVNDPVVRERVKKIVGEGRLKLFDDQDTVLAWEDMFVNQVTRVMREDGSKLVAGKRGKSKSKAKKSN